MRTKVALLMIAFVAAYACLAVALKTRLDPAAMPYTDIQWWALGIAVLFFTSIAAIRFVRNHPAWSADHLGLVRLWLGSGALGGLGYGAATTIVVIAAMLDAQKPLDSAKLAYAILGVGVIALFYGGALAVRALRGDAAIRAWIERGAATPLSKH